MLELFELAIHQGALKSACLSDLSLILLEQLAELGFKRTAVWGTVFTKRLILLHMRGFHNINDVTAIVDPPSCSQITVCAKRVPLHFRHCPRQGSLASVLSKQQNIDFVPHDWIEIPLLSDNNPIAAIFADCYGDTISDDIFKFSIKLSHIASCYHDLLVFRESRTQTNKIRQALREVDDLLSEAIADIFQNDVDDTSDLFHKIANHVVRCTGCIACDVSMREQGRYTAVAQEGELAGIGLSMPVTDPAAQQSISARAIETGELQFLLGPRSDEFFEKMVRSAPVERRALVEKLRSWGAFPFQSQGGLRGAISVCSQNWDYFASWRLDALKEFSERAALVLTLRETARHQKQILHDAHAKHDTVATKLHDAAFAAARAEVARSIVHNAANILVGPSYRLEAVDRALQRCTCKGKNTALDQLAEFQRGMNVFEELLDRYQGMRSGSPRMVAIILPDLVEEALDFWRPEAKNAGIRITTAYEKDIHPIYGHPLELLLVFTNLTSNSLYAMRAGRGSGRELRVRVASSSEHAIVVFDDEGEGMDPDDVRMAQRGESFTRKPLMKGTGLGLPYVHGIVERLRGTIKIESVEHKGTKVTIKLPLLQGTLS